VENGDDPHEADSPIEERLQLGGHRIRSHELGGITPRRPLRGSASSEKVLPTLSPPLPSHHPAPSVPPCVQAPSETAPIAAAAIYVPLPTPTVPVPRLGTSPTPLSPSVRIRPCGQTLDNRGDVVAFEFADTSVLSDLGAFEYRRPNSRNSAKPTKKDRARERDEIEPSWDVPGKSITPHLDLGLSHAPAVLGRLSQSQAHLAVGGARGSAATSPSSHSIRR